MSVSAVIMMVVAVVIIWGGLAAAVLFLLRRPLSTQPHPHDSHDFDREPGSGP